jgi:hypothetical protein
MEPRWNCDKQDQPYVEQPTADPKPLEPSKNATKPHHAFIWQGLERSTHDIFRQPPTRLNVVWQKRIWRAQPVPFVTAPELQTPHETDVQ